MTPEDEAKLTPEEIERLKNIEARKQWALNECGVDLHQGGDDP